MYKKIRLLMTALLGVTVWGGTAQINGTVLSDLIPSEVKDTVSKGEVPDVSYSLTPKRYTIAGIQVTGARNYDDFVLIGFSGLSVGDEVSIPGDEITGAVKRFWKHGLFSDVKILASRIEDGKVWLEIRLKQRPRISEIHYNGVKKKRTGRFGSKTRLA